jgi:putative endonuclease
VHNPAVAEGGGHRKETPCRSPFPGEDPSGKLFAVRRQYFVYIMTNPRNTVLYTGVTGDLKRGVWEHKTKAVPGFTAKYKVVKLVYFEVFDDPEKVILREKKIRGSSRAKKIALINSFNPQWRDLYEEL